ncbi:hypothetical protein K2173_014031 [Erythroxylum novogranatense]|uniref:Senescence-associated carboxylesterase 101 n=1 Tax=Erythroxylum novogranatense TaxID=1862640 RepID=A0AAV8SD13_9ROSI|nr:hypothetical protein K2173_014031 [Erythroxylum novogranatense]
MYDRCFVCICKEISSPIFRSFFLLLCRFCSGTESANLVLSSGLLGQSWSAIWPLYTDVNQQQNLPLLVKWRVVKEPKGTIVAFVTSPLWTQQRLQKEGDLISSSTLKHEKFSQFDFLSSQGNLSFSIHRAAVTLFNAHVNELLDLKKQLHDTSDGIPLIIAGHSLGGSIASLFALLVLNYLNEASIKLPLLCITFGSPLLGDHGLKENISEWSSCFLHVAGNQDMVPRLFIEPSDHPTTPYKPFGAYMMCSQTGCTLVDDPETVSELLKAMNVGKISQASVDYYGKVVKLLESGVILKGNSQLGLSVEDPLLAGIVLQLEVICDHGIQLQPQNGVHNLIELMERREKIRILNKSKELNPKRKLNEVKVRMTYLEWYKKDCKGKEIGYYDCYKQMLSHTSVDVSKHKKYLEMYWRKLVERADRNPRKEGKNIAMTWLYAGTNYRRMVEPLDIAEYYSESGRRDYEKQGRPRHYILLEQWQKEDAERNAGTSTLSNKKKLTVESSLTEDSCFWAKVEEALISCELLREAISRAEEQQSLRQRVIEFEHYAMTQIRNYSVSPEVFLERTSFMKWWKESQEVMGPNHFSPFADFMRNGRYHQYARGCF